MEITKENARLRNAATKVPVRAGDDLGTMVGTNFTYKLDSWALHQSRRDATVYVVRTNSKQRQGKLTANISDFGLELYASEPTTS